MMRTARFTKRGQEKATVIMHRVLSREEMKAKEMKSAIPWV